MDPIQFCMLITQVAGVVGLGWYCLETRRIRKASQQQIKASEALISAAMDQVEGLSKPCLTLGAVLRDGADTILEMHGAVGTTRARADSGSFVVHNIGNGIALNVRYRMDRLEAGHPDQTRYIQNVIANQTIRMAEPLTPYEGKVQLVFEYESIGGRKYQTTIDMDHHVLTSFKFDEVKSNSRTPGK